MAAIGDVARLAGVSKATASRALSGRGSVAVETRRRVEAAAASIGFIASPDAASLVTGRTKNVGVIIPFVNRWFFGEVLEGIERALLTAGYDLTLYNLADRGPERERVFDFFLARKRVDAVIAVGVDLVETELAGLEGRGKPVVSLGGSAPRSPRLAIDDAGAAVLATEHLLHLGHTRIAHLAGREADRSVESVQGRRLRGFRSAMADAGLDPIAGATVRETEMTLPGGYAAALQLLGHPAHRPSALFAASDEVALGAMLAAERLGIAVPGDLSIVGIDGHEYAEMFGLTTVEQYPGEQGRVAVELVMRLLGETGAAEGALDSSTPLPMRLVVRSSTTTAAR
ncbi:LacI family DNA-binding transcriptional regulator [Agromyces ramosus]|uniref:DNA-binding LacI/PurR family transcriptional regulator n=1 Tax=Agromyces ramosus TaxID=33879 RepID=A0ABU0RAJ4_9MICO|nr:LacI family DNA-binding transcriptional regulator [Agromyces ramosus]MDQ0894792.1 DNA-binding LacI/PurR family transcriptional regulator [Agromyces ramosus]